jgi:two-component system, LytTR family, response regulator
MVIFTTTYKNYAAEGFDLDAVDYLVKPVPVERFAKAVRKAVNLFALKRSAQKEDDGLFVRSEYQLVKMAFAGILYIESVEDYVKLHFAAARPVMTRMTMKAVLDKLLLTALAAFTVAVLCLCRE